jgi:hypothetical protein
LSLTLVVTIILEGLVISGYSCWYRKPVQSLVLTSICGNLLTQFFLWVVLNVFFRHYLIALALTEILIWAVESILLYSVPANQLQFKDAVLLGLSMNLVSFTLGWFLPI